MMQIFMAISLVALCAVQVFASTNASEVAEPINISFNNNIFNTADITLNIAATAKGWASFSGGCSDCIDDFYPDSNFTALAPNFPWDDIWVGVAFDSLAIHVNLSLDLHPVKPNYEITQDLGDIQFLDIGNSDVNADLKFSLEFHGWLNTTQAANISYDFDVIIPDGSVIFFPVVHPDLIADVGFNNTKIVPGNLTSSTGNLNFDFEFSLRPLLEFSASVLDINYTQEIYADVPNLELSVSQVSGVTGTCDPAPSGAPSSQIYNNLTHVVPSVGFDLVWNNDGQLETLDNATLPGLPTACLEYFPKKSQLSTPNKNDAHGNIHGMAFMALMVVGSLVVLLL